MTSTAATPPPCISCCTARYDAVITVAQPQPQRRRLFVTAQQGSRGPSHAACHVAAYCRLFAPGAAAEGLGDMASIGRVVTDMQYR
jgi:hypothetical protein